MSRFQANTKQKSGYPGMLNNFEKGRHREWLKPKIKQQNKTFSRINSRMLQMFSGKKGK